MLQPLTTRNVNISKPIVKSPMNIGDVYFNGFSWKVVSAKAEEGTYTMAMTDCTDYVREIGSIIDESGNLWLVADYEAANAKEWDSNRLGY